MECRIDPCWNGWIGVWDKYEGRCIVPCWNRWVGSWDNCVKVPGKGIWHGWYNDAWKRLAVGVTNAGLTTTCTLSLRTCQTMSIKIDSTTPPAALAATIVTIFISPSDFSGGAIVCVNCGLDSALVVVVNSVCALCVLTIVVVSVCVLCVLMMLITPHDVPPFTPLEPFGQEVHMELLLSDLNVPKEQGRQGLKMWSVKIPPKVIWVKQTCSHYWLAQTQADNHNEIKHHHKSIRDKSNYTPPWCSWRSLLKHLYDLQHQFLNQFPHKQHSWVLSNQSCSFLFYWPQLSTTTPLLKWCLWPHRITHNSVFQQARGQIIG